MLASTGLGSHFKNQFFFSFLFYYILFLVMMRLQREAPNSRWRSADQKQDPKYAEIIALPH